MATVIYDDKCGFCRRSVALLMALDRKGVHRYEGSSNQTLLREAGITASQANQELKLWTGSQIFGGYDAVVEALRRLPRWGWFTPPLRFAPVRWAGRHLYRRVAAGRKCAHVPGSL